MSCQNEEEKLVQSPSSEDDLKIAKESCSEQIDKESSVETEGKPELSEVDKLQKELAEIQSKYLYLQAEYQNYRKRIARDLSDTRINTAASTLTPFFTVFDFLHMADNAAVKSDNIESIRQGLKMIIGEFVKAFDELGVKRIEATGQKFDPELHEAVANQPSETIPEGVVSSEWNCGFKLGERILRPCRVVVSSGHPDARGSVDTDKEMK